MLAFVMQEELLSFTLVPRVVKYLSKSKDIVLKYYFVKNYSRPHDCTSVKILKYVVKLIKLSKIQVNYTCIYMCTLYTMGLQIIGRGDYLIP